MSLTLTCYADAMCTKKDISTGQTKHTFYKGYKMEKRVRSLSASLIFLASQDAQEGMLMMMMMMMLMMMKVIIVKEVMVVTFPLWRCLLIGWWTASSS